MKTLYSVRRHLVEARRDLRRERAEKMASAFARKIPRARF